MADLLARRLADLIDHLCEPSVRSRQVDALQQQTKPVGRPVIALPPRSPFMTHNPPPLGLPEYAQRLAQYLYCSETAFVVAAAYLARIFQTHPQVFHHTARHNLMFTTSVLALKFVDDKYYENKYYAQVGGVTIDTLAILEKEAARLLRFKFFVTKEEFEHLRVCADMKTVITSQASSIFPMNTAPKRPAAATPESAPNKRIASSTSTDLCVRDINIDLEDVTPLAFHSPAPHASIPVSQYYATGSDQLRSSELLLGEAGDLESITPFFDSAYRSASVPGPAIDLSETMVQLQEPPSLSLGLTPLNCAQQPESGGNRAPLICGRPLPSQFPSPPPLI